jgi:hypothetical protein
VRAAAHAVADVAAAERRERVRAADAGPEGPATDDLVEGRGLRGVHARPAGENLTTGRGDLAEEPPRKSFWKRLFGEDDR